jgi:uncharacterized membrane protein YkvA (DUF1232 family)
MIRDFIPVTGYLDDLVLALWPLILALLAWIIIKVIGKH